MADKSCLEDLRHQIEKAHFAAGNEEFLVGLLADDLILRVAVFKPVIIFWKGSDHVEIGLETESSRQLCFMFCQRDDKKEETRTKLTRREAAIMMMKQSETHDGVLRHVKEAATDFIRTFEADR